MNFCFKNIKKSTACLCLCLYMLLGFLSTNGISVCYGSEHSEHIGLNVFGYEYCCEKENTTSTATINPQQSSQSSYIAKCDCSDYQLTGDNQLQQISDNSINHNLDTAKLSCINPQAPTTINHFTEKYNKINWDIYSRRKIDNHLTVLNTVILVI